MVFDRGSAPQLHASGARGGLPDHPRSHLVLDRHVEELLKLGVQFLVLSRPAQQPDQPADEARKDCHQSSPSDADMMRAIAAVCCSQSLVSRFSVARPWAVSA